MPQQYIHVKIGLTDGVYPVRKFYTEGVFKDIYEFQENANTIAWVTQTLVYACLRTASCQ